jgi:hypothetical protein
MSRSIFLSMGFIFVLVIQPMPSDGAICGSAVGEMTISGKVSGDYSDTNDSDNKYEAITEVNGNLEHIWFYDVEPGDFVQVSIEAHHNPKGDNSCVFSCSTDGINYIDILTVTKTEGNNSCQQSELPVSTAGRVYIRLKNIANPISKTTPNTIYIDKICAASTKLRRCYWSGLTTGLWSDKGNWWDTIPTSDDIANIFATEFLCSIDSTVIAKCRRLLLPDGQPGEGLCRLNMTGGQLEVGGDFTIGSRIHNGISDSGSFSISDGTVRIVGSLFIGGRGHGTFSADGGAVSVNGIICIPQDDMGTGRLNLNGGVIRAKGLNFNTNGSINICKGVLILEGDQTSLISGYVRGGLIFAYDKSGKIVFDFNQSNSGQTTVTAKVIGAWNPKPYDGQANVSIDPTLSWTPGEQGKWHDLYFGSDLYKVRQADRSDKSSLFQGRYGFGTESKAFSSLELDATYYWRVDESNSEADGTYHQGGVWKFTTGKYVTLDDFESYKNNEQLKERWQSELNSSDNTVIGLSSQVVHGPDSKRSMEFKYDNRNEPYHSDIGYTFKGAKDLIAGGANFLALFFHGSEKNDSEQLYVRVIDVNGSEAVLPYDGDDYDLTQQEGEWWNVWNINLSKVALKGVDIKKVSKLIIGFGSITNPKLGSSGTVYFDDIRLYKSKAAADWIWPSIQAEVAVDATQINGQISLMLTGVNFSWYYDNDQIWADGSMAGHLRELKTGILRYPGGCETSKFHWEKPYGHWDNDFWDPNLDPNKYSSSDEFMNIDDYIRQCRVIGAEPLVGVNIQSGVKYNRMQDSVNEAVHWVQYCKEKNYHVKYWYIDNEPYYKYNSDALTAAQYANCIKQIVPAMRTVDPTIKIIIGWENKLSVPSYWSDWKYLIENAGAYFDIADVHWYWAWGYASWDLWVNENPMTVREWCGDCPGQKYYGPSYANDIKEFYDRIKDVNGKNYDIKLAALEWNIAPVKDGRFSEFQHALMQAEMLGQFAEGGLYMACIWPLTWGRGDIQGDFRTVFDQKDHRPTASYEVFRMYSNVLGQKLVTSRASQVHVRTVSALSQNGDKLWVLLLHKSGEGQTVSAKVSINGFTAVKAEAISVTAPQLSSNVGKLKKLAVSNIQVGEWVCSLPPHSLTMLTFYADKDK